MCEGQCGELQSWTLINAPRSGLLSCDVSASHPGEGRGGSNTNSYFTPQILVPPIHWSGTARASQAKGYKGVKQADWYLTFIPYQQVCYRVLMQLCGQYGHPALAVKVSILDWSVVLMLAYRTSWTSSEQAKLVNAMETSLWEPLLFVHMLLVWFMFNRPRKKGALLIV